MDFPIHIDTISVDLFFLHLKGSQVKKSLKIVFVLANSADPDKMPQYVAFHLDLLCLLKYLFTSVQNERHLRTGISEPWLLTHNKKRVLDRVSGHNLGFLNAKFGHI